jgi:hypothetical protein
VVQGQIILVYALISLLLDSPHKHKRFLHDSFFLLFHEPIRMQNDVLTKTENIAWRTLPVRCYLLFLFYKREMLLRSGGCACNYYFTELLNFCLSFIF